MNVIIRLIAIRRSIDAEGKCLPAEYRTFDFDKPGEWPLLFGDSLQGVNRFQIIGHEVVYKEEEQL